MFKYFNTNKNMRKNKATILVIKVRIKLLKYEWKISTGQNSGYDNSYLMDTMGMLLLFILNNILSAIPLDLNKDDQWAALPRVLVAYFVKTDEVQFLSFS